MKNKGYELIIRNDAGEELELLASGTEARMTEARTELLDDELEFTYPAEWLVIQRAA